MRDLLQERLIARLSEHPEVAANLPAIEAEVRAGRMLPGVAVDRLIALFDAGR
jgi:LAO/AO transport system kinase